MRTRRWTILLVAFSVAVVGVSPAASGPAVAAASDSEEAQKEALFEDEGLTSVELGTELGSVSDSGSDMSPQQVLPGNPWGCKVTAYWPHQTGGNLKGYADVRCASAPPELRMTVRVKRERSWLWDPTVAGPARRTWPAFGSNTNHPTHRTGWGFGAQTSCPGNNHTYYTEAVASIQHGSIFYRGTHRSKSVLRPC